MPRDHESKPVRAQGVQRAFDAAEAHSSDLWLDFCDVRGNFAVIRILIATAALACLLVEEKGDGGN